MDIRISDIVNIRMALEKGIGVNTPTYPVRIACLIPVGSDEQAMTYHGVVHAPRYHATSFYVPFTAAIALVNQEVTLTLVDADKKTTMKAAALTLTPLV